MKKTAAEDLVGTTIAGKYRLRKLLGQGGCGSVYRALHLDLGEDVALKLLNPEIAHNDTARRRFLQEVRLTTAFVHKYAVQLRDFGSDPVRNCLYFTMDLIEGRSLLEIVRSEAPITERRSIRLMTQLLEALSEAHEAGIIHRDLKPANIMVLTHRGKEEVRILDFGVAKAISKAQGVEWVQSLTAQGLRVGTLTYMSPEQAHGLDLDPRSDLFNVGAILYELLAARRPFLPEPGVSNPVHSYLLKLSACEPPDFVVSAPHVSKPMRAEILRALSKRPADRHKTAAEFRQALKRVKSSLPKPGAGAGSGGAGSGAGVGEKPSKPADGRDRISSRTRSALRDLALRASRPTSQGGLEATAIRAPDSAGELGGSGTPTDDGGRFADLGEATVTRVVELGDPPAGGSDELSARAPTRQLDETHDETPVSAKEWVELGVRREREGRRREALAAYTEALGLEAHHVAALRNRAALRSVLGDHAGALEDCDRALALTEADPLVWKCRGLARQGLGDSEGALEDFSRATELDPGDAGTWANRGAAYTVLGDFVRAAEDLTRGLELDREQADAWAGRAWARQQLGHWQEAEADYTQVLERDPERSEAWINRGLVRQHQNKRDEAIEDYTRAIEVDPARPGVWVYRGHLRQADGDHAGALSDFEEAVRRSPEDPDALTYRGTAHHALGDAERALADYTRAIELDPSRPEAWLQRGSLRLDRGEEGAREDLEAFLERAGDDPRSTAVRERIT